MPFEIVFPHLKEDSSVKDILLSLLSTEWPLTIHSMHQKIRKNYGKEVTYQAVYKAIIELKNDRVVFKDEEGYKLDSEWIDHLCSFFHKLKDNYKKHPLVERVLQGGLTTLDFGSIQELDKFLFDFLGHLINNSKTKNIVAHLKHNWRPLINQNTDKSIVSDKKGYYFLCAGKTVVDDWCSKISKNMGINMKIGMDCANLNDLYVVDDAIVQVYYPSEILSSMESIFGSVKDVKKLDLGFFAENVLEKRNKILVVFVRNKDLASQIRRQTISKFGK